MEKYFFIVASVMPVNFIGWLVGPIFRTRVKAVLLFEVRYPDVPVKHSHVAVMMMAGWLNDDNVTSLRRAVYLIKAGRD
ncbi:MAG: hypothetical protein JO371_00075 [Paraburkholderia sp.]|nr:hypothetical protein [Paraburkholderia sp.]